MDMQAANLKVMQTAESLWGLSLQPEGCPNCGQVHLLRQGQAGMLCPNCAQGQLQPQPALLRSEPPEKVVPFQVQHAGLKAIFSQFVQGIGLSGLRFDDFKAERLLERAVPLYVPMWLVDSDLRGTWQAEMGFDYQVKSSQETYSGSGWQSREVLERRARWEPRLGQVELHYGNTAVPALSDHQQMLERLGGYHLNATVPYAPGLLGDAALRVPDQDTEQAWPLAQDILKRRLAQDCQKAAGAQHLRRFSAGLDYNNLNWTQLLLPLYFTWYSDDEGKRYPVVVNGQSGAVGGLRLASQRKGWKWAGIIAAIAAGIFLLALLGFALAVVFPPAAVIGTVLVVIALLVGVGAIVPAVWPWQWNRRQLGDKVRTAGD